MNFSRFFNLGSLALLLAGALFPVSFVAAQTPTPTPKTYTEAELTTHLNETIDEELLILDQAAKDTAAGITRGPAAKPTPPDFPITIETKRRLRELARTLANETVRERRWAEVPELEDNLRESIQNGCPSLSICYEVREEQKISRSIGDLTAGYRHANDLSVQLISLATGILVLSVTFMRDVLKDNSPTWLLKASWTSLLFSIIFGIWMMMAITGNIFLVT